MDGRNRCCLYTALSICVQPRLFTPTKPLAFLYRSVRAKSRVAATVAGVFARRTISFLVRLQLDFRPHPWSIRGGYSSPGSVVRKMRRSTCVTWSYVCRHWSHFRRTPRTYVLPLILYRYRLLVAI